MRISTNWIKDYVDLKGVDLKDLALKVTKAGVNVEGIDSKHIDHLVIGYVESCVAHPDSDHLHVCMVDDGTLKRQIVCGASNVREGLKVIVALPGAILPGDIEIKKSVIRGVESNGMICGLFEIGVEERNEENYQKGIAELDSSAPVGMDAMEYLGLDDTIYTLDLNPNRSDCLSHLGFAYEVGAVLNQKIKKPNLEIHPISESVLDYVKVDVDTDKCTMYQAKMVKDVVIKESPEFIKQRLAAVGMRSINNVVDISNYIMLEYGQPLHFFDQEKVGNHILVRMAHEGEGVVTLDHKERVLQSDDIVITNGEEPVCIAGVMGCLNSDVDSSTKNILIESAIFHPYNVRYTSIRLDLRSEASLRYEKGLNYEYTEEAIKRACHLLERYADGKVLSDTVIYDKVDKVDRKASVSLKRIHDLFGIALTDSDVRHSLDALDFPYTVTGDVYTVTIPNRRLDVETNGADLIEEIGRMYGYDAIPNVLPIGPTKTGKYVGNVLLRKQVSQFLRSLGFNEVRTYTLVGEEESRQFMYHALESIRLLKPMSADKSIIRQSILPSFLKVIDYNKARNVKDICIYEIANTYSGDREEDTKIALAIKGNYVMNAWNGVILKTDFYLLKGMVEELLDYVGFQNRYRFMVDQIPDMHPGMSAVVLLDNEPIGFLGRVHPNVSKDDIFVAEFSLSKLSSKKVRGIKHKEPSRYPEVKKDMAFIVSKDVTSEDVMNVIRKVGGKLLTSVDVFDVYVGENVLEHEKSIAFSLTFSDDTRTLSDEEVMAIFNKIIIEVERKLGAKLRDK